MFNSIKKSLSVINAENERDSGGCSEEKMVKARVLVELFTYVENCIEDNIFILKFHPFIRCMKSGLITLVLRKRLIGHDLKKAFLNTFHKHRSKVMGKISSLYLNKVCNKC